MTLIQYQIDAFAERVFEGNQAAVVPLKEWLSDEIMQNIAGENNLAETAFFIPKGNDYHIRWFTPTHEVKLCGHATLASAYVLFEILGYDKDELVFDSLSGPLIVKKKDGKLEMDFPTQEPVECPFPTDLEKGLGKTPSRLLENEDYIAVFDREEDVLSIEPNYFALMTIPNRAVIATAPSEGFDFICRVFAPKYGIPEDAVTGSAYTKLIPYWSKILGKDVLTAKQVSRRGGKVWCELNGDRVAISGYAVKFMHGEIEV